MFCVNNVCEHKEERKDLTYRIVLLKSFIFIISIYEKTTNKLHF